MADAPTSPCGPTPAPSLDDLARDPARVAALPPPLATDLLGDLEAELVRLHRLRDTLLIRAVTGGMASRQGEAGDRLLDVEQAAERANVPPSWIRTAIKAGHLPSKKLGHYRRIHPDDLERFLFDHPAKP